MWESWRNVKEERIIATGLSLPEVTEALSFIWQTRQT